MIRFLIILFFGYFRAAETRVEGEGSRFRFPNETLKSRWGGSLSLARVFRFFERDPKIENSPSSPIHANGLTGNQSKLSQSIIFAMLLDNELPFTATTAFVFFY